MIKPAPALSLSLLLALAGCVTTPDGPSVMVLPGTGKTFEQFQADDNLCRNFASYQIGGRNAEQVAADSAVRSAVVGAAVGAAAGAAIGDSSRAAGTGAGAGLLIGSMAGTDASQASAYSLQRRYDIAYEQCMYAKGHKIPVSGRFTTTPSTPRRSSAYPPPPPPPPPEHP